ncbi:hypothetical protein [Rhodoferax sp.]|uniref:hypothetical protein n=1 Tax=Rhodoferax sp. TaxID=50421 RepID=UPI00274A63C9|nr:hypothetical protein [Rhodoferax sp.]
MATNREPISETALALAALLVVGAAPTQYALAAACTWNPASGHCNVAANGSCGFVPDAADTATIGGGQTSTVTSTQGPTAVSTFGVNQPAPRA